ncbi:phospholipase D family protein [Salmonella enterica]|nr:phospholipase D family protein [Salmonella enterica]
MQLQNSVRLPSLSVKSLFLTLTLTLALTLIPGIIPCAVAAPSIQVGFSPEGTAQQVVLNTINQSKKSIRMMAYSFTSPVIVKALINARKRGVDVRVVLDEKGNRGKASVAAMNLLVNAGIPVRTVNKFKILHDKIIVSDESSVETGSYNFSKSANSANSENAILITEVPELAKEYLQHWQSRWQIGQDWKSTY